MTTGIDLCEFSAVVTSEWMNSIPLEAFVEDLLWAEPSSVLEQSLGKEAGRTS